MEFDYSKLLGRIIEKFGSQRNFAFAVGKSENAISKKLNQQMAITTDDIKEWSKPELLDIEQCKIGKYFFTPKVQDVEL